MTIAKVTTKGQVTIPAQVRRELAIEEGDVLLFEVTRPDEARIRVIKHKSLSDLYGVLSATRPYPGKATIRTEVGESLAQRHLDPADEQS
jgi:AbrB family looped-hinge helix DNA binding protein